MVYLSQAGIVADGKTDSRAELQALFDRAESGGPIEIVNDLGGVLLTSGNDLWPNTTVRTLTGGTWRLAPGSTRGILRNKHPLASWPKDAHKQDGSVSAGPTPPDDTHPVTDTSRGDFNLSIIGGTYDGNRRSGGWPNDGRTPTNAHPVLGRDNLLVSTLQFYGVKHLSLQGVRIYDSPSLGVHVGNIIDMVVNDCDLECPAVIYNSNTDGFHVNGPTENLSISNFRMRQTGDDALPFNADDSMESTTEGNQATYFGMTAGWGPITHVRVRGLYLDRCSSGIRTLSATQRIDDVIISDVQGTCLGPGILLHKYLFNHDPGNIGQFTLENVHLTSVGIHYDGEAGGEKAPVGGPMPVLFCNTNIENLIVRNVAHESSTATPWAEFLPCTIRLLSVDRLTCYDTAPANDGMKLIQVDAGATLDSASLNGINWLSAHPQRGSAIHNLGAIQTLTTSNVAMPAGAQLLTGNSPTTRP